jgi:transposase
MDTTSLSFYGAGGESLGAYGHSKDHRADLKQMILAVVIDGEGRPICTEMLPGNTADAIVLLPVIDRLRERFHIGRVCVVADRGMISAATITRSKGASWNTFSAPASAAASSSAALCSRTSSR